MEAGRIFVAAAGGSPNTARSGGHETAGEKVAEQFPRTVTTRLSQHYSR